MKCIIVGHEGLIGQEICKKINCKYIGIEKEDDIFNIKEKVDFIIHLGANCIIREVIKNPELALENIKINHDVFEYARQNNIKKVIYFSSSRVLHPEKNPYTASKIYGEELCKAYYKCYGINYLIIRPETVWNKIDKHDRVITNWINCALSNKDIIVYGDKEKELTPIHVETFVDEYLSIQNNFLKNNYNDEISISGISRFVGDIINIIKNEYDSDSNVIYKKAETAQPQKGLDDSTIRRFDDFRKYVK